MKKYVFIIAAIASLVFAFSGKAEDKHGKTEKQEYSKYAGESKSPAETTGECVTTDISGEKTDSSGHYYRGKILDCNLITIVESIGNYREISSLFSESLSNVVDSYNSILLSLDRAFEKCLRVPNTTKCPTTNGYLLGQSVVVTLDAVKHTSVYEKLKLWKEKDSVTIIEDDGAVKVLCSHPSFSSEDIVSQNTDDNIQYNACVRPCKPGSAFDPINEVICHALGYDDSDPENFYSIYYENGIAKVRSEMDRLFNFSSPIETDFITLQNTMTVTDSNSMNAAVSGSNQEVTPLYLAAAGNAIVTGEFVEPYIMKSIVDTSNNAVIEECSEKKVLAEIPLEFRDKVISAMESEADSLGLKIKGCKLYAHSGTYKESNGKRIHYITVISVNNETGKTVTTVFQRFNSSHKDVNDEAKHVQEILDIYFNN